MHYPTMQNVEAVIRQLNRTHVGRISIINKGQLEFALKKPQMILCGDELYPELYQKAAVLMETIIKAHALSDGNKRMAMMIAGTMIEINGGYLVQPLKSIRLAVNVAMDSEDEMSEIILYGGIFVNWFEGCNNIGMWMQARTTSAHHADIWRFHVEAA